MAHCPLTPLTDGGVLRRAACTIRVPTGEWKLTRCDSEVQDSSPLTILKRNTRLFFWMTARGSGRAYISNVLLNLVGTLDMSLISSKSHKKHDHRTAPYCRMGPWNYIRGSFETFCSHHSFYGLFFVKSLKYTFKKNI